MSYYLMFGNLRNRVWSDAYLLCLESNGEKSGGQGAQYSGIFKMKDIGGSTEQGKKLYANYIC